MSALEEARELLSISERELKSLRAMLSPEVATEVFGFVAQQAVEKCLKAWLSAIGVEYPRVHDLFALTALLRSQQQDVDWLPKVADLNPFAVDFRYSKQPTPVMLDRADVIERVQMVFDRVTALVGGTSATS